jgi:hypothetical protein
MMKMKFLLAGLLAASIGVSAAVAAPPPGKGKPLPTGVGCKPQVTVVLKGTVDSASASSLGVDVTRANRWGRAYVGAVQPVAVVPTTKVRRNGNKTLAAELVKGDWVLVQARTCKADLANDATPALTAVRVVAHPAAA